MNDILIELASWLKYNALIYWTLTIIGFFSAGLALLKKSFNKGNTDLFAVMLALSLVILFGNFPIGWNLGSDRANYARLFMDFKFDSREVDINSQESGFLFLDYFLSRFLDLKGYFLTIALIYITNYLIAIRRLVQGNSYWLLIAAVLSMGFVSYNLNTMRAGLAISFVVLALSDYKSLWRLIALLAVAVSIHTSMVIPGAMILICRRFDNTPLFFRLWMISIPLSFVAGGFFNGLFAGMGEDQRTSYLNTTESRYNIGFRIDFILYSLIPVLVGWYYKYRKGFDKDRFYSLVYNAYLLTNIFWILVIRANYSDRFAYLSWFMIPFVLVYPLLKQKMSLREGTWLGMILLGENIFRLFI